MPNTNRFFSPQFRLSLRQRAPQHRQRIGSHDNGLNVWRLSMVDHHVLDSDLSAVDEFWRGDQCAVVDLTNVLCCIGSFSALTCCI